MKRSFLICLWLLMLTFQSCTPLLRMIYGIKNPEYVNEEQIRGRAKELFGQEVPVLVLKHEYWKDGNLLSVPDMYVFDHQGNYIPYKDPQRPDCNGPADRFVTELDPEKKYFVSELYDLDAFVSQLEAPGCSELEWNQEHVDFYLFFTFTTWSGKKLYKEKTGIWLHDLRNNKRITYKVIAVSVDLQECWSARQKEKLQECR